MQRQAESPDEYLTLAPPGHQPALRTLRQTIVQHLPPGFVETMSYGMIGYVVPHSLFPPGYHCAPSLPLPFINVAWQKHFLALYYLGLYADPQLREWFRAEYARHATTRLDMGKSCIRFKKPDQIPYELIAELCQKISADEYIETYRASRPKK